MKLTTRLLTFGLLVLALGACSSGDLSSTDAGGVLLSISDFDGLPAFLDVSASNGVATIGSLTIQNIAKSIDAPTSSLMNVEVQSFEFTYSRDDTGTRVPPPLVEYAFGVIPVNGSFNYLGQQFLRPAQFESQPFRDLLDFGRDRETNSEVVRMRVTIRVFGRTLSGDSVVSTPVSFSIDVVP
jgi:hypothetical protein